MGWQNEYQPKGGHALRLGSKGLYGLFAGKTVLPYLSALEMHLVFKGALQTLLTYFSSCHCIAMSESHKRHSDVR